MSMSALGQANPAPTSKLAKCGHSFIFLSFLVYQIAFYGAKGLFLNPIRVRLLFY
jgi:hypothetical protein